MNRPVLKDEKPSPADEMEALSRGEVTGLLADWNEGDATARDRLMALVYGELRRMAHRRLTLERLGHTMQTGTLVDEVYLRLYDANQVYCHNRKEFFGLVAEQMRNILVDAARNRKAKKRGGDQVHVPLEDEMAVTPPLNLDLIDLNEALTDLAFHRWELAQVIDLRFFAGRTLEETAEILGVSTDIVKRRQRRALTYLYDALAKKGARDGATAVATD